MVLRNRSIPRAYEIGPRIAVGGMGEVYEGRSVDLGQVVAIKRMLQSDSGELQDLFFREVAVCATLEHPNVVEVIDAGQNGPDLYLVMEYVDGPSLAELLEALRRQGKVLPVEAACGIVAQVARGLAHAHERSLPDGTPLGIIHRDVAPENVLITKSGLPKLVDFGLATLSGHHFTTPGTIRGRPHALSPEQARGEKIDTRSDIFSLGALTFEVVSGKQLYANEALATMLWKVVAGDYESVEARLPGTDPDLVQLIKTALAVDPEQRFRSAREVERALDRFRAARGMRIDSGKIASIISRLWPEILKLRDDHKEDGPGEIEGKRLVLPTDKLDVTASQSGPRPPAAHAPVPKVSAPPPYRPKSKPRGSVSWVPLNESEALSDSVVRAADADADLTPSKSARPASSPPAPPGTSRRDPRSDSALSDPPLSDASRRDPRSDSSAASDPPPSDANRRDPRFESPAIPARPPSATSRRDPRFESADIPPPAPSGTSRRDPRFERSSSTSDLELEALSALSSASSSDALRAGLRAEVGGSEGSNPGMMLRESELPKPQAPAKNAKAPHEADGDSPLIARETGWLVFLGLVLALALLVFFVVWRIDASDEGRTAAGRVAAE